MTTTKSLMRLRRFWKALEQLTGLATVDAEWRYLLGSEYELVAPMLQATGRVGAAYPRLGAWGQGLPYDLSAEGTDRFIAVDPEGGPPIVLCRKDVVVHQLDLERFYRGLCAAFSFESSSPSVIGPGLCVRVGNYRPTSSTHCCVHLTIQPDTALLHDSIRRLIVMGDEPFILLTPGEVGDDDLAQILRLRHVGHLPLCETIGIDETGALRAIRPADLLLRRFRAAVAAYEAADRPRHTYAFCREERVWILTFEAKTEYVPHREASGLAYIHHLLQRPYTALEVVELEELVSGDARVRAAGDAGEMIDDEGRRAMRREYQAVGGTWELDEDGSEAAELKAHLDAAEGLRGRPRRDADQVDRLRVRITNLITRAIQAISNPRFALHLDNSIRRGRAMSYSPESPLDWAL